MLIRAQVLAMVCKHHQVMLTNQKRIKECSQALVIKIITKFLLLNDFLKTNSNSIYLGLLPAAGAIGGTILGASLLSRAIPKTKLFKGKFKLFDLKQITYKSFLNHKGPKFFKHKGFKHKGYGFGGGFMGKSKGGFFGKGPKFGKFGKFKGMTNSL